VADRAAATRRMLEPRSIAIVGASERPGSFGDRLTAEVLRSPSAPTIHLVHPKYDEVHGRPCLDSLADIPDAVDLVLLGVPDAVVVDQLRLAADRGDGGAVVFGSVHGLGEDIASAAHRGKMALCGGGCMGFVNMARGIRAIGYNERPHHEPGPIALITHSGSVFSALLRTHRCLEYSLVVSSGQELVTTASDYLRYAVELDETQVVGLFLETLRDTDGLRIGLARALERDLPVVALTVGGSPTGRAMVSAHSGAIAGDDAAWEALFSAYGVHRVHDLDELAETLEMFAIGRRLVPGGVRGGVATLHDSGGERALVADVADAVGLPFAPLSARTEERLSALLATGLVPTNPLDVWGTGAETEVLFTECMAALADDESVDVVALSIDLVQEYDGDESYPRSVENVLARTAKPVVVLSHIGSALDQDQATRLRAQGVPVFEGTVSGARALRHLLDQADRPAPPASPDIDMTRRDRWRARLRRGSLDAVASIQLLNDYGLPSAPTLAATSADGAVDAADALGYPIVLKTDEPAIAHKSDVGGVVVGISDAAHLVEAYTDLSSRLGSRVVVQSQATGQVELALGIVRDTLVGPLILLAVGGTLVEVVRERRVALPPLAHDQARALLNSFELASTLLAGVRGNPACDRDAVVDALVAVGQLGIELGDDLEALDVNPLLCGPSGVLAVDALVIPASR
jgi:acyl-CoA synthetase (NDP forming)